MGLTRQVPAGWPYNCLAARPAPATSIGISHHYSCCAQVRSAANAVVQLKYGDDGLDPVMMEGSNCEPIDLARALSVVRACTAPGQGAEGQVPHPSSLQQLMEQELKAAGFGKESAFASEAFCASLRKFLLGQVPLA